jgi:ribosomal protein S18 acetylase RimI-like enzyme
MKIREARADEWQIIQDLNRYDPDMDLNWPFSAEAITYYKKLASGDYGHCLLAEADSKVLGYIALAVNKNFSYRKSKYIEIENIGVLPEFRSKGIGKKLFTAAKEWAKEQKADRFYVNAYWGNKGAIKFYKDCGFKEMGVMFDMDI